LPWLFFSTQHFPPAKASDFFLGCCATSPSTLFLISTTTSLHWTRPTPFLQSPVRPDPRSSPPLVAALPSPCKRENIYFFLWPGPFAPGPHRTSFPPPVAGLDTLFFFRLCRSSQFFFRNIILCSKRRSAFSGVVLQLCPKILPPFEEVPKPMERLFLSSSVFCLMRFYSSRVFRIPFFTPVAFYLPLFGRYYLYNVILSPPPSLPPSIPPSSPFLCFCICRNPF